MRTWLADDVVNEDRRLTGAGTFERSWQRNPDAVLKARDAHSLYLETLSELGPVGLGLLIPSDIVYVADTAKIGSPFANLGATLDSGGHALFFERLGAHKTMDLIVTGRLMSGTEAVASGLFSQVLPADEVTDATRAAARVAASGATQAFVASKSLIASLRDDRLGLWQSMDQENRAQAALCDTDDYREGFAAFQEKRKPEFTGRA